MKAISLLNPLVFVSFSVEVLDIIVHTRYTIPLFSSMAEGSGSASLAEIETAFKKFAMHGDTKATGKEMTGKNFSKLCKDCKVIDGKGVTSTDVDIVFSKVKCVSTGVDPYTLLYHEI